MVTVDYLDQQIAAMQEEEQKLLHLANQARGARMAFAAMKERLVADAPQDEAPGA